MKRRWLMISALMCSLYVYGCGTGGTSDTPVKSATSNSLSGEELLADLENRKMHTRSGQTTFNRMDVLYAFEDFDLVVPLDKTPEEGFMGESDDEVENRTTTDSSLMESKRFSYVANALISALKSKNQNEHGRWRIILQEDYNKRVDNSRACSFDVVYSSGISERFDVTEWGKIFKNGRYDGRIDMSIPAPEMKSVKLTTNTTLYKDVVFERIMSTDEIEHLSPEQAVSYIAHHVTTQYRDQYGCEKWRIRLEGTSLIEGHNAYEFTVMAGNQNVFRMAVADNRQSYIYEIKISDRGKLKEVSHSDPLPETEAMQIKIKMLNSYADDNGLFGIAARKQLAELKKYTRYSDYYLKNQLNSNDRE